MKILGTEGMSVGQLAFELNRGGRFVVFQYCISAAVVTFRRSSDIYFVPAGKHPLSIGWRYILLSLAMGWWGIPWGPIYTVAATAKDLAGGIDVTAEVAAQIEGLEYTPARAAPASPWAVAGWGTAALGTLGLLVLGVLAAVSLFRAADQSLWVVNGFAVPATVRLEGVPELKLRPSSFARVTVSQGRLSGTVQLGGRPGEPVAFEIREGFWERLWSDKTYVLNAGGGAVVESISTQYSDRPDPKALGGYRPSLAFPLAVFEEVDYPFEPFPKTLTVQEGSSAVTKHRLDIVRDPASEALFSLDQQKIPAAEVAGFAERHIRATPEDEWLVLTYANFCALRGMGPRAAAFLKPDLVRRPLSVAWHRAYQDSLAREGVLDALRAEYDALLAQAPSDADLLYLRGRIEPEGETSLPFMQRAAAAAPSNFRPWYAMGYSHLSAGRFAQARQVLETAYRLRHDDPSVASLYFDARLASGDFEGLRKEALDTLAKAPEDFGALNELMKVARAGGGDAGLAEATRSWVSASARKEGDSAEVYQALAAVYSDYYRGDLAALARDLDALPAFNQLDYLRAHAALASMQSGQALQWKGQIYPKSDGLTALLVALCCAGAHQDAPASEWLGKALASLEAGTREERLLAAQLKGGRTDLLRAAWALDIPPVDKALALESLAWLNPAQRRPLLAAARRMNFDPAPPHLFLARVADLMEEQAWAAPAKPSAP